MIDVEISAVVERFVQKNGRSQLLSLLSEVKTGSKTEVLTIISNSGVHPLHPLHTRGEVFEASSGSLDFSSEEASVKEITFILKQVAQKLRERSWKTVYLVPFGPAVLSMQIKALVYKVLNIDSIDVLHAGGGTHFDIQIDTREVAISDQNQ